MKDFMPSPAELAAIDDKVKVTISLTRDSVEFFKNVANKNDTNYQKMIRTLLDAYVTHYNDKAQFVLKMMPVFFWLSYF